MRIAAEPFLLLLLVVILVNADDRELFSTGVAMVNSIAVFVILFVAALVISGPDSRSELSKKGDPVTRRCRWSAEGLLSLWWRKPIRQRFELCADPDRGNAASGLSIPASGVVSEEAVDPRVPCNVAEWESSWR